MLAYVNFIILAVLIESDWNLKLADMLGDMIGGRCINRIRLEFKGYDFTKNVIFADGINRIRLEFKEYNYPLSVVGQGWY